METGSYPVIKIEPAPLEFEEDSIESILKLVVKIVLLEIIKQIGSATGVFREIVSSMNALINDIDETFK
jgi:hypothetical protein